MKFRPTLLAVVVGLAMASVAASPAVAQKTDPSPSYLFASDGRNAQLKPMGAETGTFELTMPLRKGRHAVTWFTDRPNRDAGQVSMAEFLRLCQFNAKDGFKEDPPNVAIAFDDKVMVAEMTDPNITTKSGTRVFQATMTLLKGKTLTNLAKSGKGLASHAKRAGENSHQGVANLASVTVFVDDLKSAWKCMKYPCCCYAHESTCIVKGVCD